MTTFVRNLLYRQVKDHILGELAAGHWKAGEMLPSEKLFADVLGTSTTTTFAESAAGIAAGGKTGLTSVVTAALSALSLFLSPLFLAVPGFATAPALVIVGLMMLSSIRALDPTDWRESIPAYLTMAAMPFCYSISEGIAAGVLAYVVIHLFTGKKEEKKLNPVLLVLAVVFVCKYIWL